MNSAQAILQLEGLLKGSKPAMRKGEKKIADRIVSQAKAAAPGSLGDKIYAEQTTEETTIIGGDELSAYIEFGTGIFAEAYTSTLPPEIAQEAYDLFFVNGKGTTYQQSFFYPSIFRNQDKILPAVDEELQKLAK